VAAAIACSGGSREEADTAGNPPPPDKCADFNGDSNGVVSGNLQGKSQMARGVARRIRGVDANGKDHPTQSVRLVPTCDNRTLEVADLIEGRFVGLLTGEGLDDLGLSNTPNDIVAWWVYGETSESDTIWHSQFLSLRGPANSDPKNDTMIVCDPPINHPEDRVEWHHEQCPAQADSATAGGADTVRIRPGDNPWFGCKLGCCISAMNLS
jgi:hypothetical protein